MKAQTVSFPNPDIIEIHVSKSLLKFAFSSDRDEDILSIMGVKKGDPILGKRLQRIKGITEVKIAGSKEDKYVISLTKGVVFTWREIRVKVMKIVKEVVSPKEEIEQLEDHYDG